MAIVIPSFSPSISKASSLSDIEIKNDEMDISDYETHLKNQLSANSLYLRRLTLPGMKMAPAKSLCHNFQQGLLPGGFLNKEEILNRAIEYLSSKDSEKIISLDWMMKMESKYLTYISNDENFIKAVDEAISNFDDLSNDAVIFLLSLLAVMVQHSSTQIIENIADDVIMPINNILFSDNIQLFSPALNLINSMSQRSDYARNSVTCLDLHKQMLELIKQNITKEITENALLALYAIFKNPEPMESVTIKEASEMIFDLLKEDFPQEYICIMLNILTEMSNKLSTIIPDFFAKGLYNYAFQEMDNPILTKACLNLIGNMCVSCLSFMESLLSQGLFEKLLGLIQSQQNTSCLPQVYWVISNLIEAIPSQVVSKINIDFVQYSINLADDSSFDLKEEISYFISTLILFQNPFQTKEIINEQAIELISEMLDCGITAVTIRAIDALFKLFTIALNTNKLDELLAIYQDCDVKQQLEDNLKSNEQAIVDKATYVLWQFNHLC